MAFDPPRAGPQANRLLCDNGLYVSVFNNPGGLHNAMPAHVEVHAVKSGNPPELFMMRMYVAEHEHPESTCLCRLAEACGLSLE